MLAADEVVANKISKLAQRRGYTIYQTVNEILETALRSEEMGYTLDLLLEERRSLDAAHRLGLGLTFDSLYEELLEQSIRSETWQRVCSEKGRWYGKYYKGKENPMDCFFETLGYLTLRKAEINLREYKDTVHVSITGASCSEAWLRTHEEFIVSALIELGYKVDETELESGLLRLSFQRIRNGQT